MENNPLNSNDISGNALNLNVPESSKEKYYNQYGLRHKDYRFKDFEDYLMTVFCEGDGSCILDDDLPDAFDGWIEQIDIEDIIRFGNIYGRICSDAAKSAI